MASSRYDDYKIENDFSAFDGFQALPYDEWDQDPAQTKKDFDEAVGKGVQAPHDAFVQAVAEDMDTVAGRFNWYGGISDLNNATKTGIYKFAPETLNRPFADWGICLVLVDEKPEFTGENQIYQIGLRAQNNSIYSRHKIGSNAFSAWGAIVAT